MSNWIRNTTGEQPFPSDTLIDIQLLSGEIFLGWEAHEPGWVAPDRESDRVNFPRLVEFYRLHDGTNPAPATPTPIGTPEESPEYLAAKAAEQYATAYVVIPTPDGESSVSRRDEGAWVRALVFVEYDK